MGDMNLRRRWVSTLCAITTTTLVAVAGAGAVSSASATTTERAETTPLKVASYNIRSVQNDRNRDEGERPWRERRVRVINDILRQDLDVLGIQEASQNPAYERYLVDAENQYLDLRNGLNKAGGNYQVTDADTNASKGTRILYNRDTVSLVRQGSYAYYHQSDGPSDTRYLVWAVMRHEATGRQFFFANTHLGVGSQTLQANQWQELVNKVNALSGDLPVVVVGDFQTSKLKDPASGMMQVMGNNGWSDVVGQRPNTTILENPRAQRRVKGWVNSTNSFNRNVADFAIEDKRDRAGNNCDWIFASDSFTVAKWQVVLHMDPDTLRLTGVIPSDHNMVVSWLEF